MRLRLAGRKHARQAALVVVGMTITFASGKFLSDSDYLGPLFGLLGIAVALTAVGQQLVIILDGERHARSLEREVAERTHELQASEDRFRTLVETSSDVIWILDRDGTVTWASPSAERVLGYQRIDCEGTNIAALVHTDDVERVHAALVGAAGNDDVATVEWRMRRSSGEWAHCESTVRSLLDDPSINGIVVNLRDITERKQLEQQLIRRALHDPLTGLANAALLRDRATLALSRTQRGSACALLLVDLDDFKAVNDGLGHAAGDEVLITVARRLVQAVRPGDTVARLGGDEFAVLLDGHHELAPEIVANRIMDLLREPMFVDGHELFSPASIGLASGDGVADAEALLRDADAAMYIAKGKGKSQVEVFRPEMHFRMKHRLTVATELRKAVSGGQLALRYQPIVDLKTCRIIGFEALVRWRHPDRGLVMPDEFIPLAEDTGTIVALGQWVFAEACAALAGFHSLQTSGEPPVKVTVNLSARQFLDKHLVADLAATAREAKAPADSVTLELTETTLMDDVDAAIATLEALKRHGFHLALDDFGTGYSSLSYLKRLPLDVLKIDKSFVRSLGTTHGEGMIQTILRLGETFDLQTLAEGIEDEATRLRLRDFGCTYGQGYLFAKPIRKKEAQQLLLAQSRDGSSPFWLAESSAAAL
ncbi:MAG TPA: EAL domain-containing protein [Acidimicrobiales bacterium]|nr:EAL domain-containing protein [Acidimicrobiales bacterium]